MQTITLKSVTNGFVVTRQATTPTIPPTEYVFSNWDDVTSFLTGEGFIPTPPGDGV